MNGGIPSREERELGKEAIQRIREQNPDIVRVPSPDAPEPPSSHDPELCAYCLGLDCFVCTTNGWDLHGCAHERRERHGAEYSGG